MAFVNKFWASAWFVQVVEGVLDLHSQKSILCCTSIETRKINGTSERIKLKNFTIFVTCSLNRHAQRWIFDFPTLHLLKSWH